MKIGLVFLMMVFVWPAFGLKDFSGDSRDEVKKAIGANPAPSGFAWVYLEEINAGILQPENWTIQKDVSGDVFVVTLSEEGSEVSENFRHEFRMTFTPGRLVRGMSTKVAQQTRDSVGTSHKVVFKDDLENGSIQGFNCIYLDEATNRGVFALYEGNWMTNSMYQIEFSAPQRDFDRYFKSFGIPLVNYQIVDKTR